MRQTKPKSEAEKAIDGETEAVIEVLLKKYGATPEGVFGKGRLIKARVESS